jgi:hypothetical protein
MGFEGKKKKKLAFQEIRWRKGFQDLILVMIGLEDLILVDEERTLNFEWEKILELWIDRERE